jgi:hypothetical protein
VRRLSRDLVLTLCVGRDRRCDMVGPVVRKRPQAVPGVVWGAKDLEDGARTRFRGQADRHGFMTEVGDGLGGLDQGDAGIRVLRLLVVKVLAMFRVEFPIEGDIMIAWDSSAPFHAGHDCLVVDITPAMIIFTSKSVFSSHWIVFESWATEPV